MITLLRRSFWLALLVGAGYAVWTALQRHNAPDPAGPPEWPPLDSTTPPPAAPDGFAAMPTAGAADVRRWVEPVDGGCPEGYPIKANDNSRIYHLPGGRFYGRTVPERCYARTDDAQADGYRAAKS